MGSASAVPCMNRILATLPAAAAAVLAATGALAADAAVTKAHRETPAGGCVTEACHKTIGKGRRVHDPVKSGRCASCHVPSGGGAKDFALARKGRELCASCHSSVATWMGMKSIHGPVGAGACGACHVPHQSEVKGLLKEGQARLLCIQCHEAPPNKNLHGPVGAGNCQACHDPHASPLPYQLRRRERELCLSCHEDRAEDFGRRVVHKPAIDGCLPCHEAHSSPTGYLLRREGETFCYGCHRERATKDANGESPHKALGARACTGCHQPHSSDEPKLLRAPGSGVCTAPCHRHDDIKKKMDEPVQHGPFGKGGSCPACHSSHATPYPRLLALQFSRKSIVPYERGLYEICWKCHKPQLVEAAETSKATGFRNGTSNLHTLHVIDQSYSCRVCHESHAGDERGLLRKSVNFSSFVLSNPTPFVFTRGKSGGECEMECHEKLGYDRVTPVRY